jgi:hypothetical protein
MPIRASSASAQRSLLVLVLCVLAAACNEGPLSTTDVIGTWEVIESRPMTPPIVVDTSTVATKTGVLHYVYVVDSLRIEIAPARQFDPSDSTGLHYALVGRVRQSAQPVGAAPRYDDDCCAYLWAGRVGIEGRDLTFEPCTAVCGNAALFDGRVTEDVLTVAGSIRTAEAKAHRPIGLTLRRVSPCIGLRGGSAPVCFDGG